MKNGLRFLSILFGIELLWKYALMCGKDGRGDAQSGNTAGRRMRHGAVIFLTLILNFRAAQYSYEQRRYFRGNRTL